MDAQRGLWFNIYIYKRSHSMDIYFYRPSLLLYPWILYKKSMEFQEFLCYGTPPYSVHALEGRNVEGGGRVS